MWFKKPSPAPAGPTAGIPRACDGRTAILDVAAAACDAVGLHEPRGSGHDVVEEVRPPHVREIGSGLGSWLAGHAAAGLRSCGITTEEDPAPSKLPFVLHAIGALPKLDFVLSPRSVQEAADFVLVAQRIAELALTSGAVRVDPEIARSVQPLRVPDAELIGRYLGTSGDSIDAPTPSQSMLFGRSRRLVPALVDVDRSAGVGPQQTEFAARVAQRPFFGAHVAELADRAMKEFWDASGRACAAVSATGLEGAEIVVVATGAIVETLEEAAALLRSRDGIRAGVVNLSRLRPLPAERIAAVLNGPRAVTVLERADDPVESMPPLAREIRAVLRSPVDFFSGVCEGLSLSEALAVFRNMLLSRRRMFFVGARFSAGEARMPNLEILQQTVHRLYPDVDRLAVVDGEMLPAAEEGPATQLHSYAGDGGVFAGNLLAQAQYRRTTVDEDRASTTRPCVLTIGRGPVGTMLFTHASLLQSPALSALMEGGSIYVVQGAWASLPREARERIAERKARLFTVAGTFELIGAAGGDAIVEPVRKELARRFGAKHAIVEEAEKAMRKGATEIEWATLPPVQESPVAEPTPPWAIRELRSSDGTVFDAARFWDTTGFAHASGRQDRLFADPFTGSGVIPGRTSAGENRAPLRSKVPTLANSKCTGCGMCWTLCPESALPASLQSFSALVGSAIKAAGPLTQLPRMAEPLAKLAHRLFAKSSHRTLGPLLSEAFAELAPKLGLQPDPLKKAWEEFAKVVGTVEHLPIVRTKAFFDDVETSEKGAGRALSIALNLSACKGCLQCVQVCPEQALEATAEVKPSAWEFLVQLPDVPEEVARKYASSPRYDLLDRRVYHALVGGDGSFQGDGAKVAVRLAAAAATAVMRPRVKAHVARLSGLIDRLQERIQGKVSQHFLINDFEKFGRRLSQLGRERLDVSRLTGLMRNGNGDHVDRDALARMTDLLAELKAQKERWIHERAGLAVAIDPRDGLGWIGAWPFNPAAFPWIARGTDDLPAYAEGLAAGVAKSVEAELRRVHEAQCEIDESSSEFAMDADLVPPILVVVPSSASSLESVAKLLRNPRAKVLVVDSIDPRPREHGMLGLAMPEVFVLHSSIGDPDHLLAGLKDGLRRPGPALFHVHAPDPQNHGFPCDRSVEQARKAIRSRLFPLFRIEPGRRLDLSGNPAESTPVADWAAGEARFRPAAIHKTEVDMLAAESAATWNRLQEIAAPLPPAEPAKKAPDLQEALAKNLMEFVGVADLKQPLREFLKRIHD